MPNSAVSGSRISRLALNRGLPPSASTTFAACSYIDPTTHPLDELGKEYAKQTSISPSGTSAEAVLRTCHRFERYWAAHGDFALANVSPHGPVVSGHGPVSARLAQIAAGVRSLIVGERFVYGQVRAAFFYLPADHLLLNAATDALATAVEARRRFQLQARLDYSGLARMLLDGEPSPTPGTVVVVGGGMLARSIADELTASRSVVMVTRSPKRLRRRLADSGIQAGVSRASTIETEVAGRRYDLVLATSGLEGDYRERIVDVSESQQCRSVIDLCATRTMSARPAYLHLHHPNVLAVIEDANRDVYERAVAARSWIDHRLGGSHDI